MRKLANATSAMRMNSDQETAAPYPAFCVCSIEFSHMYMVTVCDWRRVPPSTLKPLLKITGSVNNWRPPAIDTTVTKRNVGCSNGKVTDQNCRQLLAPS